MTFRISVVASYLTIYYDTTNLVVRKEQINYNVSSGEWFYTGLELINQTTMLINFKYVAEKNKTVKQNHKFFLNYSVLNFTLKTVTIGGYKKTTYEIYLYSCTH